MTRRGPATVAAVLAALTLVATLPVPCACLPEPAKAVDHGCCAPAAGWRVAELGCCTAVAEPAPATTPAAAPAVVPALVAVAGVTPSAATAPEPAPDSPDRLPSPPLTVRRV